MRFRTRVSFIAAAMMGCIACSVTALRADVNLEWRPSAQVVRVNDIVEIGLYAVYTGSGTSAITAMDVLPNWDPAVLQLLGALNNGPYSWLNAGSGFFPGDSGLDGLNNTWTDGNAKFTALAQFLTPAQATLAGLKVVTFQFRALAASAGSNLTMAPAMGQFSRTVVYGNAFPGQEITGTLGSAIVIVCPGAATGDMDANGQVDGLDIGEFTQAVLSNSALAADVCPGDFDNDHKVGVSDINGMVTALLSQ